MRVDFFNYNRVFGDVKESILCGIGNVIDSGIFINGKSVDSFEKIISKDIDSNFLGCSNGTDAITLALTATLNFSERRKKIIVPSFTFVATAMSAFRMNFDIVFVDCDPESFHPSVGNIISIIDKDTHAVIWPHLFGEPTDLRDLYRVCKKEGVFLIEDCAQSFMSFVEDSGRFVGTQGDFGTYSFFPVKNLGAFGDAGGVSFSDGNLRDYVVASRSHGYLKKYQSDYMGGNFRMDTIQAEILISIYKTFSEQINIRKSNAKYYIDNIDNDNIILPKLSAGHTWNQFTILVDNREKFINHMKSKNIDTQVYYPVPLHKNKVFDDSSILCNSESICKRVVSIPIYPGLRQCELDAVVSAIREFK